MAEMTRDIGSVLHANTSTLFMAQQSMDVAIRALGPSPFAPGKAPNAQEVDAALAQPVQTAVRSLEAFLAVLADPERQGPLAAPVREELADFAITLADYTTHFPIEESRVSGLRHIACRIQDVLGELSAGKLPKEPVRNLKRAAHEIERITALASLLQTRSAILQMDYSIRSFREFVTANLRRVEEPRRLRVITLVEIAHRQLADYAHSSNVEVRPRNDAGGAQVVGVERELVRAFANLLHNAIKYSWHREASTKPWVSIHITRHDQMVRIAFENWGVPISAPELEHGMVFELGYRGKWSTDRGRLGTGIGLTDAREVIEKHKGTLVIESRPARSWGPEDPEHEEYYRQPFLTTVTVSLPEAI